MIKNYFKKHCAGLAALALAGSIVLSGCGNTGTQTAAPEQQEAVQTSQEAAVEETEVETDVPATTEAVASETAGELKAEFAPNEQYDKYTLIDYTVEDIAAQFVATVSAKEDGSEYEVHCNLDGEEELVVLDKDLNIVSDKNDAMSYDAPIIVKMAIDADNWTAIEK